MKKHIKEYLDTAVVLLLLLAFFFVGCFSALKKSPTYDEIVHLTGGYAVVTQHDFRINSENGTLPQIWAALPLVVRSGTTSLTSGNIPWGSCNPWEISNAFLLTSGNDCNLLFIYARSMMLLAAAFAGACLFLISKKIWGRAGGFITLILFLLSPNIMANARLVTSDLFAALFFTLSIWLFFLLLQRFSLMRLFFFSLSTAALFLSKMSAPLIIPLFLILSFLRLYRGGVWRGVICNSYFSIRRRWLQLVSYMGIIVIAGVVTFSAIWSFAGFRYSMIADDQARPAVDQAWNMILQKNSTPQKILSFCREHRILPEFYIYGAGYVLYAAQSRYSFLDGQYSDSGWWYFFPLTFVMKTPFPMLMLFMLGLLAVFIQKKRSRSKVLLYRHTPFLILIAVYISVSMLSHINIGVRHLLVIYLPLFVIAGGAACFLKRGQVARIIILLFIVKLLLANIMIYPDYLAYFSSVVGGSSNGYKHLVDSSLDWGQDLKGVKEWLTTHDIPEDKAYISYFGSLDLRKYGVKAKHLLCRPEQPSSTVFPLKEGYYCISATMLQMAYFPKLAHWGGEQEKALAEAHLGFKHLYSLIQTEKQIRATPETLALLNNYRLYEKLRFAKLAAFLRTRTPVAVIGHSYFIFYVTQNELEYLFGY